MFSVHHERLQSLTCSSLTMLQDSITERDCVILISFVGCAEEVTITFANDHNELALPASAPVRKPSCDWSTDSHVTHLPKTHVLSSQYALQ